ncbi:MAG TPA: cytochrome c biogenesis protein DipZ [Patescibacteria group bacterium]|nr:cytochrome c biogenesis protein DipZ [Patescibacteria group bacterium]
MAILLFLAFLSGLVTILAPCIWPILPIVLSASATGGRKKPLGITFGILGSFGVFTLTIAYLVRLFPIDPEIFRYVAVGVIGLMGIALLVPWVGAVLESYVSRLSGRLGRLGKLGRSENEGFGGGLLVGASLGIVWTPCAGPILGTIAALSATRSLNADIVLVTIVYLIGVGIPLFLFASGSRVMVMRSRALNQYTGRLQQAFGILMVLTAIAIYTGYDRTLQAKLLDTIPSYSQFLNDLEGSQTVRDELGRLKRKENVDQKETEVEMNFPRADRLPKLRKAPELVGIHQWLNSEPQTLESLRGKVVLIDFWTYTCINCIRTLPHLKQWYETYKDDGFFIIGVHTPEFEFEKKTENVEMAIKQYGLTYPVAQDNNYSTWRAYDNHYWPAKYLIDAEGYIRYTHFGEGKYEETEEAIRALLQEAGTAPTGGMTDVIDQTPGVRNTQETYLGAQREEWYDGIGSYRQGKQTFTFSTITPQLHHFALNGGWFIADEYAEASGGSQLTFRFLADKVFLVIHPSTASDTVTVKLDGEVIPDEFAGADVKNGVVTVTEPRLYELINLHGNRSEHTLLLEFHTAGTRIFAFTFG